MKTLLLCFLICLLPLDAQFSQLASSQDGSQLYFISQYRLRGHEEQNSNPKLFRYDARTQQFEMLRQGEAIGAPEISSDNGLLVYTDAHVEPRWTCFQNPIGGAPICQMLSISAPYSVLDRGTPQAHPGIIRTSPDGRFAMQQTESEYRALTTALLDLSTGARRELQDPLIDYIPASGHRVVSNSGSALVRSVSGLSIADIGGQSRIIAKRVQFGAFTLDDNASVVVYEEYESPGWHSRLKAWFADSASTLEVAPELEGGLFNPSLSFDGGLIAFLQRASQEGPAQAWLIHSDNSSLRRLTDAEEGISECALSPDGATLWAVTNAGRILRVDTWTSVVEEVNPPTPYVADGFAAPGSALTVHATGLDPSREDYRLYVWGRLVPLLEVTRQSLTFQLPWDFADLAGAVADADLQPPHPIFEQAYPKVRISEFAPQFLTGSAGAMCGLVPSVATFHPDGTAVTHERPAASGETIWLAMTGLGPVDPGVASGEPSPDPPPGVLAPIKCFSMGRPIRDFEATLWPGQIGVYRLSATFSSDMAYVTGDGCALISCQMGLNEAFGAFPFLKP